MSDTPTVISTKVTLALWPGMTEVKGRILTVMSKEKKVSLRTLCPGCLAEDPTTGVPVITLHSCQHEHGPYLPGATKDCKGRQDGDRIIPLSATEIAQAKGTDLDGLTMQLAFHPVGQIAHLNRPTGVVYAFDPGADGSGLVGVLLEVIAQGELAIFGEITVKKGRRFMRLQAANHGLELVELARPEDVYEFEDRAYPYDPRARKVATMIIAELTTDYDPKMYLDGAAGRLADIMASKDDGPISTVTPLSPAGSAADFLEAQLEASLAAIRARKAAA